MNFFKGYPRSKRAFDIILSGLGLFFSLPLWVLFSFAIWLEGGRPIFYVQARVGKGGLIFKAVKFRTMGYRKENSRLAVFLRTTALDELPQLLNILEGQMSFVGPRPLIPEEVPGDKEFSLRSLVLPGLTGAAQVLISKDSLVSEKLRYDIWYIKNQNLRLDIYLVLKSFWMSLNRKWDVISKNGDRLA